MITVKHWKCFDEDRKDTNHILVIYGASFSGRALMQAGTIPTFFADRNAHEIKKITSPDGEIVRVLDLDELRQLKTNIDIWIGITNKEYDISSIIEDLCCLFSEPCDIRIYGLLDGGGTKTKSLKYPGR